jgi:hypothetical protein
MPYRAVCPLFRGLEILCWILGVVVTSARRSPAGSKTCSLELRPTTEVVTPASRGRHGTPVSPFGPLLRLHAADWALVCAKVRRETEGPTSLREEPARIGTRQPSRVPPHVSFRHRKAAGVQLHPIHPHRQPNIRSSSSSSQTATGSRAR